jgi:hypothetical protein
MYTDDFVVAWESMQALVVLRLQISGTYRYVGKAYVHGLVDGKLISKKAIDTLRNPIRFRVQ